MTKVRVLRIDIDLEEYIDVPELFTSGRQRVIQYVIDKYGMECICQILAMGTMGTRIVLKDVARTLDIDHNKVNKINKFIPSDSGKQWPLAHCLYGDKGHDRKPIKEIVEFANKHPYLFKMALEFEGLPRHSGIHAAGVIISPKPVDEVFPLFKGKNGEVVAQFDKKKVEELGALKMDFLGLRTLGVMHKTIDLIKKRYGKTINKNQIPMEDPKVLNAIRNGYTDGMFQIESNGFKDIFRQMNEVNFEDVIAALSLFRPGPMKFIPDYISRKNGYSETSYLFPALEPILNTTFGIIVYQEQVMKIATEIAGFTEGEADLFRRAIGKFLPLRVATF